MADFTSSTLRAALTQASARLAITAHAATARMDAELLLLHITGLDRAALLTHPDRLLTFAQLEAYFQAIERRAQSEPIQYITGVQEFYGLTLQVTPAVLIPRPETEHLVEAAIGIARPLSRPVRILDIGTGSGAIAIALAHALPAAAVVATDISPAALAITQANAEHHNVAGHITFLACDLLPPDAAGFDLICSNPPYIASGEPLESQVAAYEPHTALFAGPSGLEVYQRLIPLATAALRPGGALLLEIGHGQSAAIESLLAASNFQNIRFLADLRQIPRIAVAHKPTAHAA